MVWLLLVLLSGEFDTAFRAGLVALNTNNLEVAESQLESAARMEPRDARVWLALAQTYWKLHKPETSLEAARKSEEYTSDGTILRGLAMYYSEAADYAKSAHLLQAAIRISPKIESYPFELAQLYLKEQKFAEALDVLDAARKRFSDSAQLELAAGVAYYGLRRFPEAADAFLRTVQLDPSVDQPYSFLGRMLDQAEDRLPRITKAFAVYASQAPKDYMSRFLYGKALALQDPGPAEHELRESIAVNGEFWESHFELGILLDRRGQFEEAAREVRRGIELKPDEPAPHYRLARLYDRLGKPEEARAERELHTRLTAAGPAAAGIK